MYFFLILVVECIGLYNRSSVCLTQWSTVKGERTTQ